MWKSITGQSAGPAADSHHVTADVTGHVTATVRSPILSRVEDAFQLLSKAELARRRARLLSRIQRRYDVVDESFVLGPLQVNFTRVKDADRVLDQVCDEQDARERATDQRREGNELHLPYWAELWDSSIGVGHWLVRSDLRNRQVLDLGCGMGFAGTVAAAMGHRVILADLRLRARCCSPG